MMIINLFGGSWNQLLLNRLTTRQKQQSTFRSSIASELHSTSLLISLYFNYIIYYYYLQHVLCKKTTRKYSQAIKEFLFKRISHPIPKKKKIEKQSKTKGAYSFHILEPTTYWSSRKSIAYDAHTILTEPFYTRSKYFQFNFT